MTNNLNRQARVRTCPTCLKREVRPAIIDYHTIVKLDRTKYRVHVPELTAYECSNCGEQLFGDKADEQIDDALRDAAGLLRSAEILRRRKELGLTQKQLADLIGSSPEAVCRWERGLIVQGRMANRSMMIVFQSPEARRLAGDLNRNPKSQSGHAKALPLAHLDPSTRFVTSRHGGWSADSTTVAHYTAENSKHAA